MCIRDSASEQEPPPVAATSAASSSTVPKAAVLIPATMLASAPTSADAVDAAHQVAAAAVIGWIGFIWRYTLSATEEIIHVGRNATVSIIQKTSDETQKAVPIIIVFLTVALCYAIQQTVDHLLGRWVYGRPTVHALQDEPDAPPQPRSLETEAGADAPDTSDDEPPPLEDVPDPVPKVEYFNGYPRLPRFTKEYLDSLNDNCERAAAISLRRDLSLIHI